MNAQEFRKRVYALHYKVERLINYKYRILILLLGIVSTISAVGAGLTGNLAFYTGFTSSRYLSESVFSWRVSKKVPLILIGGLLLIWWP